VGWLVIVAGAAVFVAALVAPLDDAALVVALMLAVRAGRLMVGNEVPMLIKSSPRAAVHQMAQIGKNTDSAPWRGT
jgi:hypothetical protein